MERNARTYFSSQAASAKNFLRLSPRNRVRPKKFPARRAWAAHLRAFRAVSCAAATAIAGNLTWSTTAHADDKAWTSKGEISFESRWFPENELSAIDPASGAPFKLDPTTDDYGVGMLGRAEAAANYNAWRLKGRAFGRVDAVDEQRSALVVEEAWAQYGGDWGQLRVGADIINWTATEAFHPADIINARNLDSDFENLEKLGEPMVALTIKVGKGRIVAMGMPFYTEPIMPSPRSRLSFAPGLPVRPRRLQLNTSGELTDKNFGGQGALQIAQTFGPADIAIHAVHHLDRYQPVYVTGPVAGPAGALLFQTVTQVGLTYAQSLGSFLTKLELGYRYFHRPAAAAVPLVGPLDNRDHAQMAVGGEYMHTHPNSFDSTILIEGQFYAGIENKLQRRALGLFQRDVLVGYRLAFNDIKDKSILLLGIFDLENAGELMASVAYQQRLSDVWGIEASARAMHAPNPNPLLPPTGIENLRRADQVRLALTRYF